MSISEVPIVVVTSVAVYFAGYIALQIVVRLIGVIDRRLVPIWRRHGWRGDGGTLMLILTICLWPFYLLVTGIYRLLGIRMPFDDDRRP